MDLAGWQERFDGLARLHGVPGASLALLSGGQVEALATGLLNVGTGVAATTDSLFQIGSITKLYTATVVMHLVEQGLVALDTPVAEILPGFRVADEDASRRVTVRNLLAHTSGISGEPDIDAGRGDDCLERYVGACVSLGQCHPLGKSFSYCNAGYSILGRIIERLTGMVWDTALRELLLEPAGLASTWTLPEDVIRFRAAMGHLVDDGRAIPAPTWSFPRADGPQGLICATAADVLGFAELHLASAARGLAEMRQPQIALPNPHDGTYAHWGLGWALFDWGRPVFGHDGATIGQSAALRVVPDAGVAVALLANTEVFGEFCRDVFSEVFDTFAEIAMPAPLAPPAVPARVDVSRYVGVYERSDMRVEVSQHGGDLRLRVERIDAYASLQPPRTSELVAVADGRFLQRSPGSNRWLSTVFSTSPQAADYLYLGTLAFPKLR
jgi:CubicO group peptidase (beta-lactamase class C family)